MTLALLGKWLLKKLLGVPWQAWAVIAIIIGLALYIDSRTDAAYSAGYAKARAKYEAQIDKMKSDAAEERQKNQKLMDAEALKLIERMEKGYEERDKTIADLRRGALRLRDKFTCKMPTDSKPSAGGDGQGTGGFSSEDAEFLIREASRADSVARRLSSCQAILDGLVSHSASQ